MKELNINGEIIDVSKLSFLDFYDLENIILKLLAYNDDFRRAPLCDVLSIVEAFTFVATCDFTEYQDTLIKDIYMRDIVKLSTIPESFFITVRKAVGVYVKNRG